MSLRGKLLKDTSLASYTSWRVGGKADQLYLPADLEDLSNFLEQLNSQEPLVWLGLGSNTLIRDGGIRGTVIVTQPSLHQLTNDQLTIRAEAGVACPALARYSARLNLEGLEFLAGIPGTVGGALRMNAGCHGGETWNLVSKVETIDRCGKKYLRTPEEYKIAYRSVSALKNEINNEWFTAGHFLLKQGDKEQALEKIRELLAYRTATQPTNEPNCGSVFRNPPNNYAAKLIEACGLKGYQLGGAIVSPKHANFIINSGHATAKDIESLIEYVAQKVEQVHNIQLIREVHILGQA